MVRKRKFEKWKPVELNENLISNGVEGLVGIEELTDYNLIGKNTIKSGKKHGIKKKVQVEKLQDVIRSDDEVESHIDKKRKQEFDSKKRKLKRKRKRKRNVNKVSTETVEVQSAEESDLSDDNTEETESVHEPGVQPCSDSMSTWNGLGVPDPILKALEELGFTEPTEIQGRTLPAALMGRRDILGAAETGSGKTLAFGIPILHRILEQKKWDTEKTNKTEDGQKENDQDDNHSEDSDADDNKADDDSDNASSEEEDITKMGIIELDPVQIMNSLSQDVSVVAKSKLYALVLTPTRELAMQVCSHLKAVAKYTGVKVAVVVGGLASQKQERLLSRGPEIVVATPGRLWELIQGGNPHLAQVRDIRCLVIDETDRMLEKGHFQELHSLLELLNVDEGKKSRRQNFVFSATLTMVHDPPSHLKGRNRKLKVTPGQKLQSIMSMLGITNPKVVDVTKESGTAGTLTEAQIMCELEEKDFYLFYFVQRHRGRTLVFCNSISCVRRLAQLLALLQCRPLPLHANMMQRQRLKNLDRFREDPCGLLLATDVAARGLDIPGVQHVIHYQVPRTSESYVHRSGRTARAQNEGLTLLLIEPSEAAYYTRLCRTLGRTKDLPSFPVSSDALAAVKQRVALAREVDQLELSSRRTNSETGWFRKALTDMDMLVDEDDLPRRMDQEENSKVKRLAAAKRKQLSALLSKPLFSHVRTPSIAALHADTADRNSAVKVLKSTLENSGKIKKVNVCVKKKQKRHKKKRKE